jgi:adenine-specific DNA-methyltransferase
MSIDLRARIATALHAFNTGNLPTNCIELLDALGYRSGRRLTLSPNTAANFERTFAGTRTLNHEQARVDEWTEANFLLQLTDDEFAQVEQLHLLRERDGWNNGIYRSFAFIAIGLTDERYSRTVLATITRAVNRLFMMPTPIFFRYGDKLTLAIILRRPGKRDTSKDVLEKVTLIKDIDLRHPHAAHIRILEDLALANLRQGQSVGNFDELQSAWSKTLDISELNKRFYQELANWYYWAVDTVTFPRGDSQEDAETRNAVAVIRLITRLIFVWFIKEKGLVPDELFARDKIASVLHDLSDDGDSYYKAILQNLFFATLNTEMNTAQKPQSRIFHSEEEFQGQNRHFGVPNVYRYARMFAINQPSALALFAAIPFLNGGLFECLDRPEQGVRIDGFSDRADNPLCVPNVLFFGNARPLDLNEVFGTHNKQYQVRGLFDIFHRYKFTIEENTPIDEEVALDPELLGKVFENLLAAYNPETRTTARKQTGSFYTPREIVDYMVDEALIAYLAATLRQHAALAAEPDSQLEARLRHLFAYTDEPHQFTANEVAALIDAIDRIKILDPACGSGAFPMGVLHKLVFILRKLDPNNARWKEQQLARVQRDRLLAEQMEDEKNREHAIKEIDERIHDIEHSFAEQDHELDYTRKLYLIENCIYGVDIQPIAVQIAKLRFFISLVADQRVDNTAPNRNVRALPNMETKFVAANTLIGLPRSGQMMLRNPVIDRPDADLRRVRQRHFTARTAATKKKYREEDKKLRQRIGELLQQDGWPRDMTVQLAHWDPYDQNAHAEFFDLEWMFGVTEGVDVVLGNPPYIDSEGMVNSGQQQLRDHIARTFRFARGNWDIYIAFFEVGFGFLGRNGHLTFITPDKWMSRPFGNEFRKHTLANLRTILLSGRDVFTSANVDSVVTFLSRKETSRISVFEARDGEIRLLNEVDKSILKVPYALDPLFSKVLSFILRLDLNPIRLSDLAVCENACATSDAYKLVPLIRNLQSDSDWNNRFFKIVNTGTIGRYTSKWGLREMVYLGNKYLMPVVEREVFIQHFANSYGLKASQRKIIIKGLTLLDACIDDQGNTIPGKSTLIICHSNIQDLKFLLGFINSKLPIRYIKEKYSASSYNTGINFTKDMINNLPLPGISAEAKAEIVGVVDQILAAKTQNSTADVSALEAEIDHMVYDLYGLTAAEIQIVEGTG